MVLRPEGMSVTNTKSVLLRATIALHKVHRYGTYQALQSYVKWE